jgi:hypothetical protein
LLVAGIGFAVLRATITWKEFLLQLGISAAMVTSLYFIARWQSLTDVEHLNGRVTGKDSGDEKCCHCRMVCDGYREVCTGTGKNRSCSNQCTGYHEECDHSRDYWWRVNTSVGNITIDDCEPNSMRVPLAWTQAKMGEPASVEHTYTNYLKADPDSLLVHEEHGAFLDKIPEYPRVHDFYKVDPIVSFDVPAPPGWQEALREINADFGARVQVDVTMVLTRVQDPMYAQALEARWLYGPKNSLNVVMGVKGDTVSWVRVVSISRVEALKVHLRDRIEGKKLGDPEVPKIIRQGVKTEFRRKPMHDFEYLAKTAQPKGWVVGLLYLLALLVSCGLGYYMHRNDVFGDERPRFRWDRY